MNQDLESGDIVKVEGKVMKAYNRELQLGRLAQPFEWE